MRYDIRISANYISVRVVEIEMLCFRLVEPHSVCLMPMFFHDDMCHSMVVVKTGHDLDINW